MVIHNQHAGCHICRSFYPGVLRVQFISRQGKNKEPYKLLPGARPFLDLLAAGFGPEAASAHL
jgi:hypothetical protein